jgi:hypothetical protein
MQWPHSRQIIAVARLAFVVHSKNTVYRRKVYKADGFATPLEEPLGSWLMGLLAYTEGRLEHMQRPG